jgi:hypothetical protein
MPIINSRCCLVRIIDEFEAMLDMRDLLFDRRISV